MKNTFKNLTVTAALGILAFACEDIEKVTPVPNTHASNLSANFLLVNGSDSIGQSLDLYINNQMRGASVVSGQAQSAYTNVPIFVNATSTNGVQSTNIRVKATSGKIGGKIGSSDLIFRAGSTSTNNFQAGDGGSYTVIVLDSIRRPVPVRTNNSLGIGDLTYYSTLSSFTGKQKVNPTLDTTIQLVVGYNSIVTANLIKKYNNNNLPATFFPIGTVPLGITDPGGLRFLVVTDNLPLPATSSSFFPNTSAGKFSVRFINASPDVELVKGAVTCSINGTAMTSGAFSYPMSRVSGSFDPAVGSRFQTGTNAYTVGFKTDFMATGTYLVEIKVGATVIASIPSADFTASGAYTLILTGRAHPTKYPSSSAPLSVTLVKNK